MARFVMGYHSLTHAFIHEVNKPYHAFAFPANAGPIYRPQMDMAGRLSCTQVLNFWCPYCIHSYAKRQAKLSVIFGRIRI